MHKRSELIARKMLRPANELKRSPFYQRQPVSLYEKITSVSDPAIIAEFKRKSPSRGDIHQNAQIPDIVTRYQKAGATAVSILTDEDFFGGSLDELVEARTLVDLPLLRKDFIIDPYQLMEAKSAGADIVLLIAAMLDRNLLSALYRQAGDLGLEVLVEIHHPDELEKLPEGLKLLGVNNRDLKTMKVRIETSIEMVPHISSGVALITESGLSDTDTIFQLWNSGFKGFLIGEYLMKQADPGQACKILIENIRSRI